MNLNKDCITTTSWHVPAVLALENTLQKSLLCLKDLIVEINTLFVTSENYKTQYNEQKDKCTSNSCQSSEALKKVIDSKDKIIQLAASTLTKLNDTKNLNIVNELFIILCGDIPKISPKTERFKTEKTTNVKLEPESQVYSPEKSLDKEESLLEIEGTPTGRVSPIIQSKKFRSISTNNPSDFREKKKCPDTWPTPEKKTFKLSIPTPSKGKNTRLKQSRLNLIRLRSNDTLDLTNSPEFSGGCRTSRSEIVGNVQPLIKKESVEDDTILPSPTSGPTNFANLYKTTSKSSPIKFKPPSLLAQIKMEKENNITDPNATEMEESINLLQPKKLQLRNKNGIVRESPKKSRKSDENATNCDTFENNESLSLLQHVKLLETMNDPKQKCSPTKRPLEENQNITNIKELREDDIHIDSSMSLLSREVKPNKISPKDDKVKRKILESAEAVYKEPTVRKKAEKLALPGWSCDECKIFYDELYKDDPEMLAKKMDECSKHRGRNNPARPKTPTNFWNPRWDVPEDTEEFNKRNNAT